MRVCRQKPAGFSTPRDERLFVNQHAFGSGITRQRTKQRLAASQESTRWPHARGRACAGLQKVFQFFPPASGPISGGVAVDTLTDAVRPDGRFLSHPRSVRVLKQLRSQQASGSAGGHRARARPRVRWSPKSLSLSPPLTEESSFSEFHPMRRAMRTLRYVAVQQRRVPINFSDVLWSSSFIPVSHHAT